MGFLVPELLVAAQTELGECPVWDPQRGIFWFMDITSKLLHELRWESRQCAARPLPALGGALVLSRDGSLIAGLQTGLHRIDPSAGTLTFMVNPQPDKSDHRLNEAKCDPQGRLWFGSISTLGRFPTGCLYRMEPGGSVQCTMEKISVPNTLVWLGDPGNVLFADSARRVVWRFHFDGESGAFSNRSVFAECHADRGMPDGAALDAEGHVWIAEFGGGRVKRYDPDGRVTHVVELPATQVTSCAFAGPGLRHLIIITTKRLLSAEERTLQTHAGDLFVVEPEVPGILPYLFG